jgi:hypothetical protein
MITVRSFLDNLDNNDINDITQVGYDEDDDDQYFWDMLKEHVIKKRIKEETIKETYELLQQFLPNDIIKYHIKEYSLEPDYEWRLHNLGLKIVNETRKYIKYFDYPPALVNKKSGDITLCNENVKVKDEDYPDEIKEINCKLVILYLTKYGLIPYTRLWYWDFEEDWDYEYQRSKEKEVYDEWDMALHSILNGKVLCRMSVRDLKFRLEFNENEFYDVNIRSLYRAKYPFVWFEIPSNEEVRPFKIKLMEDDDVVFTSNKYYV